MKYEHSEMGQMYLGSQECLYLVCDAVENLHGQIIDIWKWISCKMQ